MSKLGLGLVLGITAGLVIATAFVAGLVVQQKTDAVEIVYQRQLASAEDNFFCVPHQTTYR